MSRLLRASLDGLRQPSVVIPVDDPAVRLGWAVFETLAVQGGVPQRLCAHLVRLQRSAAAALVPWPASSLEAEVHELIGDTSGWWRLRITLSRSGRRWMQAEPFDAARRFAPVHCASFASPPDAFVGGAVKHASRLPWCVAVARAGVDDLILHHEGEILEATTAAVVALRGNALWSAPDDGRVLPSVTLDAVIEAANTLGIDVERRSPPIADPGPLYLVSCTRGFAPVLSLDGEPLAGSEGAGAALTARLKEVLG